MGAGDLPPAGLSSRDDWFMLRGYVHALVISMAALLVNSCPLLLHRVDAHCHGREW